jgi:hypothetical protein
MRRIGIISLFISLFVLSCEPGGVSNGEFDVPPGFPTPVYHPVDNGMNQQGYYLGRKLFFDPILSRNGTISCGSCHHPTEAFSDQGNVLSVGIDAQTGHRNSPPLFNLAWQPAFMWDGDGDGYHNILDDNCPEKYGTKDGCPDSDGDGIIDAVGMDTDGDGEIDTVGMDTDGDGEIDAV